MLTSSLVLAFLLFIVIVWNKNVNDCVIYIIIIHRVLSTL